MNFLFGDFNIDFIDPAMEIRAKCKPYRTELTDADCCFEISDADIQFERLCTPDADEKSDNYIAYVAAYRKLADWLPMHNAFVLHSAVIDADGTGVAFAAHSGTGKTTHMLLWQRLLGEKMKIVNGDKPIVRFFENEPETPYAYGTPWNGKEHLGCNMRTPLRHICFIERAAKNSVEPMRQADAVNLIFNQVYMPHDPAAAAATMVLINRLLSCCKLWKIRCNMEPEAAEVAYRALFPAD